jgi:large subunit ribosomal protein L24
MNIRKNDNVLVIAGNDIGKQGKVLKVFPERGRIIIEGVNIIRRHQRPTQKSPQGGIVQKEGSINVTNVLIVCPKCNNATRVGRKRIHEADSSVSKFMRVCKNCGDMF